jgi:cell fate (sporulation/competence/biofilm development) regulator YmcA (YheA/YmcA/DUF963 family)
MAQNKQIAERLWSSEEITDLKSLHKRLKTISFRLEELESYQKQGGDFKKYQQQPVNSSDK